MAMLEEGGSGRRGWPEPGFARCFVMFCVEEIKKDLFDICVCFCFLKPAALRSGVNSLEQRTGVGVGKKETKAL